MPLARLVSQEFFVQVWSFFFCAFIANLYRVEDEDSCDGDDGNGVNDYDDYDDHCDKGRMTTCVTMAKCARRGSHTIFTPVASVAPSQGGLLLFRCRCDHHPLHDRSIISLDLVCMPVLPAP